MWWKHAVLPNRTCPLDSPPKAGDCSPPSCQKVKEKPCHMETQNICIVKTTGCPTKHDPHDFCLISLGTIMLESWGIIHWKGGIHSFVWSTKTFLYDIWEPRYKQIKMGYQISKCLNIGQSQCLEIWCPILFYFNSAPLCFTEMGLIFQHVLYGCHL